MKTTYLNCTTENIWHEDLDQLYVGVFQVVFPILIVTGTLTNILNLVVLTRPMMRNKSYRWLRTLGVVDLLLCLLTTPVCLAKAGLGPSPYVVAVYYSHFGWSLSIGSQIISFYLMGWFAYDRYLAVCQHTKYPDSQRYKVFRKRVLVTVVGVVALYLPTMVVGYVCKEGEDWIPVDGYSLGKEVWWWYTVYSWVREILSRLVPAVVLTFCNAKITLRLKHLRSIWDGFGSGVSPARKERERRLVRLLFWVTALFYVFNTPVTVYYLVFLNQSYSHSTHSILTFGAISNLLQMMGNISNFVLYFLVTPDFHRTLLILLHLRAPVNASITSHTGLRSPPSVSKTVAVADSLSVTRNGTCSSMTDNQFDSGFQLDVASTPDNPTSPDDDDVNL